MKILMANKFLYRKAGAEKYFFDLGDLLRSHGHEVVLWGMKNKQATGYRLQATENTNYEVFKPNTSNLTPEIYNVSYLDMENPKGLWNRIRVFFRILYSFEAKKKFTKLVNEFKPDVVHIHNIYHQLSPSFLDVCRIKKIPVVMSVHDYKIICPNYKLFANGTIDEGCKGGHYFHDVLNKSIKGSFLGSLACALELWFHHTVLKIYEKSISLYLCPSEFVKDTFIEFGIPKEKTVLLRYFLDQNNTAGSACNNRFTIHNSRFTNEENENLNHSKSVSGTKFSFRKSVPDTNFPYIFSYGRLSEEKGFDVLIQAMKDIDVKLKIAGSGPDENKLKKLASDLGLDERIEFLGWKEKDEIDVLIRNAHLIIVPSVWHDPSPFALLECLSLGKIVIGSRVGGITENLEKIDKNLLYEAGNKKQLAKKIQEYLSLSQEQLFELVIKGKKCIQDNYEKEDHYLKLFTLYTQLISIIKFHNVIPIEQERVEKST